MSETETKHEIVAPIVQTNSNCCARSRKIATRPEVQISEAETELTHFPQSIAPLNDSLDKDPANAEIGAILVSSTIH